MKATFLALAMAAVMGLSGAAIAGEKAEAPAKGANCAACCKDAEGCKKCCGEKGCAKCAGCATKPAETK